MSTLTSLVKSGKRKISKTQTGFTTATKTAPDLPDGGVPREATRPEVNTRIKSNMTTLGRTDPGVSPDPLRPREDTLHSA